MAGVKEPCSGYLIGWAGKAQTDSYQDAGFVVFFKKSLIHMVIAESTKREVFKGRKHEESIDLPSSC